MDWVAALDSDIEGLRADRSSHRFYSVASAAGASSALAAFLALFNAGNLSAGDASSILIYFLPVALLLQAMRSLLAVYIRNEFMWIKSRIGEFEKAEMIEPHTLFAMIVNVVALAGAILSLLNTVNNLTGLLEVIVAIGLGAAAIFLASIIGITIWEAAKRTFVSLKFAAKTVKSESHWVLRAYESWAIYLILGAIALCAAWNADPNWVFLTVGTLLVGFLNGLGESLEQYGKFVEADLHIKFASSLRRHLLVEGSPHDETRSLYEGIFPLGVAKASESPPQSPELPSEDEKMDSGGNL